MKKLIPFFAVSYLVLMLVPVVFANDYTQQQIGNFKYTNGSNGYSGNSQQIGNSNYYNDKESHEPY